VPTKSGRGNKAGRRGNPNLGFGCALVILPSKRGGQGEPLAALLGFSAVFEWLKTHD